MCSNCSCAYIVNGTFRWPCVFYCNSRRSYVWTSTLVLTREHDIKFYHLHLKASFTISCPSTTHHSAETIIEELLHHDLSKYSMCQEPFIFLAPNGSHLVFCIRRSCIPVFLRWMSTPSAALLHGERFRPRSFFCTRTKLAGAAGAGKKMHASLYVHITLLRDFMRTGGHYWATFLTLQY